MNYREAYGMYACNGILFKHDGELVFDTTKPDGTQRKLMDVGRLTAIGWQASVQLKKGLPQALLDLLEAESRFR